MNRILVIDPANLFAQHVELALNRYGYSSCGVGSANEAVKILENENFDLIIAHDKLPDMDWPEFCQKAIGVENKTDVPVIVLSSDPGSFDDSQCRQLIVTGIRTWPVSMQDLAGIILQHLPYQNRRRGIRASLAMKAQIREGGKFVPCQILNLSEGGVFVMRKEPAPMDAEVEMLLSFKEKEAPLEVRGKVMYIVETARGRHPRGMGVKFNELDSDIRDKLNRHLEDYVSSMLGR